MKNTTFTTIVLAGTLAIALMVTATPAIGAEATTSVLILGTNGEYESIACNEAEAQIAKRLPEILNTELQIAAGLLLKITGEYEEPTKGIIPEDSEKEVRISAQAMNVFFLYERYQLLYGKIAARNVRPIMSDLFSLVDDKLAWTYDVEPLPENLAKIIEARENIKGWLTEINNGPIQRIARKRLEAIEAQLSGDSNAP